MAYADDLVTIRDNLATVVKNETAAWVTNGPKATYSIDGQSVSWNEWLTTMMDRLAALDEQIAATSPFEHSQIWYT